MSLFLRILRAIFGGGSPPPARQAPTFETTPAVRPRPDDNIVPATVAPPRVSRYALSARSLERLVGVDDRLVRVVKRAIEITEQDFSVLVGVRTREEQYGLWRQSRYVNGHKIPGKAHVTNLNGTPKGQMTPEGSAGTGVSNHQTGRAVDLGPHPLDWNDIEAFKRVGAAMRRASRELGVEITWGANVRHGGDWTSMNDMPHHELKGEQGR